MVGEKFFSSTIKLIILMIARALPRVFACDKLRVTYATA